MDPVGSGEGTVLDPTWGRVPRGGGGAGSVEADEEEGGAATAQGPLARGGEKVSDDLVKATA